MSCFDGALDRMTLHGDLVVNDKFANANNSLSIVARWRMRG
jgi:hypothetical protein